MITRLEGIRPKPLSRYLCALGVLRLLAEQHASDVAGCWRGDAFELHGISRDDLDQFFVEQYAPTPVFSPWNKEGDPVQNARTRSQLAQIEAADSPRFGPYRETMAEFRHLGDQLAWTPGDNAQRLEMWRLWRSVAPDAAIAWLDGAVTLTGTNAPKPEDQRAFSPLLGTGGVDSRFEISRLFQAEIIRIFLSPSRKDSPGWLSALCDGGGGPPLVDSTLGQFDADATGGINSAAVGRAPSASNPWAIVLTIEGCLSLAAGASSRLGFGRRSVMAVPFFVRSAAIGPTDCTSEEERRRRESPDRGELWAPLWSSPTTWPEMRLRLSEGRLQWQGHRAASAVDAARAIGSFGASRGIDSFERFGFVKRNGRSFVAVPRGRLRARPLRGVPLLAPLDAWLRQLPRGDEAPDKIETAARAVDSAQLAVVTSEGTPSSFGNLLVAVARLERAVSRSGKARERVGPFPRVTDRGGESEPLLPADQWLAVMDDGSSELRIAASLASLRDVGKSDVGDRSASEREAALAIRQITMLPKDRRLCWPGASNTKDPAVFAFREAPEAPFLTLLTRRLHAAPSTRTGEPGADDPPSVAAFEGGLTAPLGDVTALLSNQLDLGKVRDLLGACTLLSFATPRYRWHPWTRRRSGFRRGSRSSAFVCMTVRSPSIRLAGHRPSGCSQDEAGAG